MSNVDVYKKLYTKFWPDTQCSHHERCPGGVLWVPQDEETDDQYGGKKDADKHQTPRFRSDHSIYGLSQYDTQCNYTCNCR